MRSVPDRGKIREDIFDNPNLSQIFDSNFFNQTDNCLLSDDDTIISDSDTQFSNPDTLYSELSNTSLEDNSDLDLSDLVDSDHQSNLNSNNSLIFC